MDFRSVLISSQRFSTDCCVATLSICVEYCKIQPNVSPRIVTFFITGLRCTKCNLQLFLFVSISSIR